MNWYKQKENPMPNNELLLVIMGDSIGLRSNHDGDLYNENNDYDDSGLEVNEWCYIPTRAIDLKRKKVVIYE